MAAVSERVFVKYCSPSLASKLPCTTTSAGLSGLADSMEMLAACTEPADKAAQANAGNRMNCCLCLRRLGPWQAPRTHKGENSPPFAAGCGHSVASSGPSAALGVSPDIGNRQVFCCFAANLE